MATPVHEQWSSRATFILAAMGSAIGLGNIWRFPFVTGENGGGAFVLLYLGFIVFLGVPALIAMVMIGRRGQNSPIYATRALAVAEGHSKNWALVGWLTVIAAYLVLTFFSVIASFSFEYMLKSFEGVFQNYNSESSKAAYDALLASPYRLSVLHGIFMLFTVIIVARGIKGGIEKATAILMPGLFIILIGLVLYALIAGDGMAAITFLFAPDFSKITPKVILEAMGQAMFTLSVGGSGMIAYGAYLSKEISITRSVTIIAAADTAVALLAGLMIFPIVFASGLEPSEGAGLIFVTLPIAFGQMPGGDIVGVAFFVLLLFAALSTSIAMSQPVVAWLEERFRLNRVWGSIWTGALAWFIGLLTVFSFNILSDFHPFSFIPRFADMTIFLVLNDFISNIALPFSAFCLVIFSGWVMSTRSSAEELNMESKPAFFIWHKLVRFVIPVVLIGIFVMTFLS